jgi:para-aminobenzoate synthetase/4-amino-4-deoxychorismate lyase
VVGWLAYEAGLLQASAFRPNSRQPLLEFGVYDGPTKSSAATPWQEQPCRIRAVRMVPGRARYLERVRTIQDHIACGNVYQVNFTGRLHFILEGDPCSLFLRLFRSQPAAFASIFRSGERWILSFSPELFVAWEGDSAGMRPMKGTCPRGRWEAEDLELARQLSQDEKSRAENLMIVDLIRNDLGRLAEPGGVHVSRLYETELLPTVIQMTSSASARLRPGVGVPELLAATFPSGSVTGAPKLAAMELIQGLEPAPRGVYCGALGTLHATGGRLSVGIRTLVLEPSYGTGRRGEVGDSPQASTPEVRIYRGVMGIGSGIVADSDPVKEWDECRLKARFLTVESPPFELLETMCWENGPRYWPEHRSRLLSSARYFGFEVDPDAIEAGMHREGAGRQGGWRLRLQVAWDGNFKLEWAKTEPVVEPVLLGLAEERVDPADRFLYHKTTCRELYRAAQEAARGRGLFDVVFRNRRNRVTEGSICNLFIRLDGRWVTPPRSDGLLAGVMRERLIQGWSVRERSFGLRELRRAEEIVVTNSVRGILRARLVME